MSDLLPFLRAWVADPKRVASITPSGTALTDLMTREIRAEDGPVLELGPGTGVVTRGLLARGVPQQDLTLIEAGSDFARTLSLRFPRARPLHGCNPAWSRQSVSAKRSWFGDQRPALAIDECASGNGSFARDFLLSAAGRGLLSVHL